MTVWGLSFTEGLLVLFCAATWKRGKAESLAQSFEISFLNSSLIFWMHFTKSPPSSLQIELIKTW